MIKALLILVASLLFQNQVSVFECLTGSTAYTHFAYSYVGDIASETGVFESDIEGVPVDWYSLADSDFGFYKERAVYSPTDNDWDYLYILRSETFPQINIVYILETFEEGEDGHPHGCGAYYVEHADIDWLFTKLEYIDEYAADG